MTRPRTEGEEGEEGEKGAKREENQEREERTKRQEQQKSNRSVFTGGIHVILKKLSSYARKRFSPGRRGCI